MSHQRALSAARGSHRAQIPRSGGAVCIPPVMVLTAATPTFSSPGQGTGSSPAEQGALSCRSPRAAAGDTGDRGVPSGSCTPPAPTGKPFAMIYKAAHPGALCQTKPAPPQTPQSTRRPRQPSPLSESPPSSSKDPGCSQPPPMPHVTSTLALSITLSSTAPPYPAPPLLGRFPFHGAAAQPAQPQTPDLRCLLGRSLHPCAFPCPRSTSTSLHPAPPGAPGGAEPRGAATSPVVVPRAPQRL